MAESSARVSVAFSNMREKQTMPSRTLIYLVSALVIPIVAAAFLWGLSPQRNANDVSSALIDDLIPDFALLPLEGSDVSGFVSADLRAGEVVLVNVFASWCYPCRVEHPFLMRLSGERSTPIYGINYKDKPSDALNWLAEQGNPYIAVGADESGQVSIDWGISGVPETLVIDRGGAIRYRHVGPLSSSVLEETILPLIRSLREEAS
jgi:cytochrome c biogenesis protein CcmG/thiol:disulfide interchange protein DsbE